MADGESVSAAYASDTELYKRIWYADRDGKVQIGIDLRRFNRDGSPTFSRRDNGLPLVLTACSVATAWMLGGWIWGLAILASGIIFSITTLNLWVMHRLRERTLAEARCGLAGWETLWRFGGISLRYSGEKVETVSPANDWRDFAYRLPPVSTYEN
jgi:hypothetical protein